MTKTWPFVKYWLPVLVWMCLIFSASTSAGSFQNSSRIIGPIVRWLFPSASGQTVNSIIFAVRKCAHVSEYAVLAVLLWRALRKPVRNEARPWSWALAMAVTFLVMLYASSDEFHQLFVPGRQASVWDVMLDTSGGILGLALVWAFQRLRPSIVNPRR